MEQMYAILWHKHTSRMAPTSVSRDSVASSNEVQNERIPRLREAAVGFVIGTGCVYFTMTLRVVPLL